MRVHIPMPLKKLRAVKKAPSNLTRSFWKPPLGGISMQEQEKLKQVFPEVFVLFVPP